MSRGVGDRASASGSAAARTPVLQRSIERRNPCVDPLSFIQVELLRRQRRDGASEELARTMLLTINGTAGGLRNTG